MDRLYLKHPRCQNKRAWMGVSNVTRAAVSAPSFCELLSFVLTGYRRIRICVAWFENVTNRREISHIGIEPQVVLVRLHNYRHSVVHIDNKGIRSRRQDCATLNDLPLGTFPLVP